jgi:hypothetical protein
VESREEPKQKRIVPTASAILDDGTIVELVYRPDLRRTFFALYGAGRWTLQDAIDIGPDFKLVPFSANNNLIKNDVVLIPSEPPTTVQTFTASVAGSGPSEHVTGRFGSAHEPSWGLLVSIKETTVRTMQGGYYALYSA